MIKLKINNVKDYEGVIEVETDANGVPLDKFWRKRLADAEIDNCVELVDNTPKKKASNKPKEERAK